MDKIQPRMKTHYDTYVRAKLQEEFAFSNSHQIPTLEKIVLNVGVGEAAKDQKLLVSVVEELEMISGQKANTNRAKRSISTSNCAKACRWEHLLPSVAIACGFFLIALSVLRSHVSVISGLINKIVRWPWQLHDGHSRADYFPEINFDNVKKIHGMDLTFVTSTQKDDEGFALLRALGFPFRGEVPVQVGASA